MVGFMGSCSTLSCNHILLIVLSVTLDNAISYSFQSTSGVPEGSHLGLVLSVLHTNDIACNLRYVYVWLYTDDVKIFKIVRSTDTGTLSQKILDELHAWSETHIAFGSTSLNVRLYLDMNDCARFIHSL